MITDIRFKVMDWNVESDPEWEFMEAETLGGCILPNLNDEEHQCLDFEAEEEYVQEEEGVVSLVRWCSECENTEKLFWRKK